MFIMPKKTKRSKKRSKKISFKKELNNELKEVEQWIHERRKFFKKLGWVVILIVLLIIVSNLYLKVKGVGI